MAVSLQCEECNGTFEVYPSQSSRRWCSWECRTARPRNFCKNGRVTRTCEQCDSQFETKRSKKRKFCSFDCYNEWRNRDDQPLSTDVIEKTCPVCDELFETYPSRVKSGRGKFCSRSCSMSGRPIRKRSQIADETIALWRRRHPELTGTDEHRLGRWAIDLAFTGPKIAVELDGTYWHSLPEMVEKDRRKDRWLRGRGWDVIRIEIAKSDEPTDLVERMEQVVLPELRKAKA